MTESSREKAMDDLFDSFAYQVTEKVFTEFSRDKVDYNQSSRRDRAYLLIRAALQHKEREAWNACLDECHKSLAKYLGITTGQSVEIGNLLEKLRK